MMIHNFVKYLIPTRCCSRDIKITNFLTNEVEFGQYILRACAPSYYLHMCFFEFG
jgi:hypothetical protein